MTQETRAREAICRLAASMFQRGLTFGSSGNLSVRVEDGWLMTPTNASMGDLDPARLAKLDDAGRPIAGDPPTKEAALHLGFYEKRSAVGAVVHLHSTYSVAVSLLEDTDPEAPIPPLTAYYVMRVGNLKMLPYFPPGDPALAEAVREAAARTPAVLLANHGPVVAGASLEAAVYATEELEETAKLHLLLRGERTRPLTAAQVTALLAR